MDGRLLLLAVGGFVGGTEGALIGSLLPGMGTSTGVSVGQAGLIAFGYAIAYAIGTPILSAMFGHSDRRKLLVASELGFGLCALALALGPTFESLIVARTALALAAGLYTTLGMATALDLAPPERRGRAMGTVIAGRTVALIIGVPAGALLANLYGWRAIYFSLAGIALVAAAVMWVWMPRGLLGQKTSLKGRIMVLGTPGIPVGLLTNILFSLTAFFAVLYIAPIATGIGRLDKSFMPLVLLATGIGGFFGSTAGGQMTDRLGPHNTILIVSAAQIALFGLLWFVPLLPAQMAGAAVIGLVALLSFVSWCYWPAQSTQLAALAPTSVPLALSVNLTALNIGVAVAAVIGGNTIDTFGIGTLPLAALACGIATLLVAFATPRDPPRTGPSA